MQLRRSAIAVAVTPCGNVNQSKPATQIPKTSAACHQNGMNVALHRHKRRTHTRHTHAPNIDFACLRSDVIDSDKSRCVSIPCVPVPACLPACVCIECLYLYKHAGKYKLISVESTTHCRAHSPARTLSQRHTTNIKYKCLHHSFRAISIHTENACRLYGRRTYASALTIHTLC